MTYRLFLLLSLFSLFSCSYTLDATSLFERFNSITETSLGAGARALAGDEPITDAHIITMVKEAQEAFGLNDKSIKVYWIKDKSPFALLSDAVWGDTIFLNEDAIGDNRLAQEWIIWHSMSHIKQHDYGTHHVYFALSSLAASAIAFKKADIVLNVLTFLGAIPTAYISFVRSLERKTDIRAAEALCKNNKQDIVEKIRDHYKKLDEEKPAGSRPFILFQTFQQTYNDLCSVLDNHTKHINQNTNT